MAVDETYLAAIRHDIVDVDDATLVGVVRRPTGWFRTAVDENHPELGPPEDLLDETKRRTEGLKRAGMCDEGAHNAAWEDVDFMERYRSHLADGAPRDRLDGLRERLASGEDIVLVCFEGDGKRCHRHHLVEVLKGDAETTASRMPDA